MLAKGDACLPCRVDKKKCNGVKPQCPRCLRLSKQCVYGPGIIKHQAPTLIQRLEARTIELEIKIRRLVLASTHDVHLASGRLLRRVERLGCTNGPMSITAVTWSPIHVYPVLENSKPEKIPAEFTSQPEDYNALNYSAAIDPRVAASSFTGLEELPFPLSFHLINIFLPYRDHFCFSMDIAYFLRCLSLPSSHPESIHPCLLNACYLAACVLSRGRLSSLEPYFVNKTRHFLEQSLMFADRIPHFLLASMILGSYFRKLRRLEEAFAVISSAGHLATACGLLHESHTGLDSSESLLPPPNTEREAAERMELARSIYITDQSLVVVSGYPMSFAGNDYWGSPSELLRLQQQQQESNTIEGREHSGLWPSDEFLKVSVLKFFERVKAFALLFCESGTRAYETTYLALSQQLSSILAAIPPLPNPQDLQPSELSKAFGLGAVVAHSTLNGSGLILHSLRAGIDPEARRQMLRCMRGVVETVRKLQELRNIQKSGAQASLISMFHVMNAVRIVAQELQKSEVRRAANSSTHYFQTLEVLLDHLEDGSLIYPEWANTHAVLKEPLTTALQSLEI